MATLADSIINVKYALKDTRTGVTEWDSRVLNALNDAVAFYLPEKLWFQEYNAPISVTAGQTVLTLPTDLSSAEPWEATIVINGAAVPFPNLGLDYLNYQSTTTAVQPMGYVYDSGVYRIVPVSTAGSDGAYTVNLRGWKSYPAMVIASGGNDFLTYAAKMVESKAISYLQTDKKGDIENEVDYGARALQELRQHRIMTNNKRRTGVVGNDGGYIGTPSWYSGLGWGNSPRFNRYGYF